MLIDAHTKQALTRVFVCARGFPERLFVIDAHTKQALTRVFVCAPAIPGRLFVIDAHTKHDPTRVSYVRGASSLFVDLMISIKL